MVRISPLATARLALCFGLALALPAVGQAPPDYGGTWSLETVAQLPNDGGTCIFTGAVTLEQDGNDLTGDVFVILVDGPAACPPTMMATLGGAVDPMGCVSLGTLIGPLGQVTFAGCPGDAPGTLNGTWQVESGPFQGGDGTWSAVLQQGSVLEVPSLTEVGLTALALLLLVSGLWMLRRRSASGGGAPPAAWS